MVVGKLLGSVVKVPQCEVSYGTGENKSVGDDGGQTAGECGEGASV